MKKEVEIIKLGDIFGPKGEKPFVLIITDGGPIIDHYNKVLMDHCKDDFKIQRTSGGIVQERFGDIARGKVSKGKGITGVSDGDPIIGQSYTINNSSWHTSTVNRIVDNNILITDNSVYVIHSVSELRDRKLNELGI